MQQLELFPETVRVERIDLDQNMHRFYRLRLQPDLFGGVSLLREWGRIGTAGRQMINRFDDAGTALDALLNIYRAKRKRGYHLPSSGRRHVHTPDGELPFKQHAANSPDEPK